MYALVLKANISEFSVKCFNALPPGVLSYTLFSNQYYCCQITMVTAFVNNVNIDPSSLRDMTVNQDSSMHFDQCSLCK